MPVGARAYASSYFVSASSFFPAFSSEVASFVAASARCDGVPGAAHPTDDEVSRHRSTHIEINAARSLLTAAK